MSEIAKKEKARRVWRLNKKEGIPVLEALETVDISKDVYYRIKGNWEDKWEEEILTVEQIQKRLAEVDEKLEKREKKLKQLEDRILDARRIAGGIEGVEAVRERADEAFETGRDLEDRVEHLEIEADIDTHGGSTVGQLQDRVRQLESQNLPERVNHVEKVSKSAKSRAEKNTEKISRVESEIPTSIWELV